MRDHKKRRRAISEAIKAGLPHFEEFEFIYARHQPAEYAGRQQDLLAVRAMFHLDQAISRFVECGVSITRMNVIRKSNETHLFVDGISRYALRVLR